MAMSLILDKDLTVCFILSVVILGSYGTYRLFNWIKTISKYFYSDDKKKDNDESN